MAFSPLLDRNRQFAAAGGHADMQLMPRMSVLAVTCLDHRVDPAAVLGLELGEGMVVRNAGGRVTPDVLQNLAFISLLAELQVPEGPLFEIAVIHHTQCGTSLLAVDAVRHQFSERAQVDEATLLERAVTAPDETVRRDVGLVLAGRGISPRVSVSGHVYAVETGQINTVVPARPVGENLR